MFNRKLCYEDKSSNIFTCSLGTNQEEPSAYNQESNYDFGTEEKNENNVNLIIFNVTIKNIE
jgi:hypothetical protein